MYFRPRPTSHRSAPRQRLRLLGGDSETNRTRAISPSPSTPARRALDQISLRSLAIFLNGSLSMFALRRTAKVVRSRALAIVSTLFALRTSARSSLSCSGSKALVASCSFPLRLHSDLPTTIFNRAARLRTAAVLRFYDAIG